MITDEELLKLYNPNAKHKNPGHLRALRAVYEQAIADAAKRLDSLTQHDGEFLIDGLLYHPAGALYVFADEVRAAQKGK